MHGYIPHLPGAQVTFFHIGAEEAKELAMHRLEVHHLLVDTFESGNQQQINPFKLLGNPPHRRTLGGLPDLVGYIMSAGRTTLSGRLLLANGGLIGSDSHHLWSALRLQLRADQYRPARVEIAPPALADRAAAHEIRPDYSAPYDFHRGVE